ncbi:MAG: response regulator [Zoogloea sp.]|nr:response regulator [Zoogloea sp.]
MQPESKHHCTVLVVEDDPIQGFALEMLLGDAGLQVRHFLDACSAEAWLRQAGEPPKLILSDYRLDGDICGLALIRRLRDVAGQSVPAVLLTGDLDDDVTEAAAIENCGILHKPCRARTVQYGCAGKASCPLRRSACLWLYR